MTELRVIIFDVEHGFCAFLKSPTGRTLLIDCGKKSKFSPIKYLIDNELPDCADEEPFYFTKFILSHPHGDHVEDIENLKTYKPRIISRQSDYDWEAVEEANTISGMKKVNSYKNWQKNYDEKAPQIDWGFDIYQSDYLTPSEAKSLEESTMVNNSSIPVIVNFRGTQHSEKFLFAGDLEEKGWKELLKRKSFKEKIKGTDFFITSHHGHSSGYCKEIFEAMGKPILNIVSTRSGDASVELAYSKSENSHGIDLAGVKRYMLSTRNDGSIRITVDSEGKYFLRCDHYRDNSK